MGHREKVGYRSFRTGHLRLASLRHTPSTLDHFWSTVQISPLYTAMNKLSPLARVIAPVHPRAIRRCMASSSKTPSPVIFSGIQPSGTPHVRHSRCFVDCTDVQLGNYLGLFLPFLELQKNSAPGTPVYLSIVGLHAITMLRKPEDLRNDRRDMLAVLIAAGVDPERTCLYFQEDVSLVLSPLREHHAPRCDAFAHVRFVNTQSSRGC